MKPYYLFFFALIAIVNAANAAQSERVQPAQEYIIALLAPQAQEFNNVAALHKSSSAKPMAQSVGIGRNIPQEQQSVPLSQLQWATRGEYKVAHITVSSTEASSLRVAVQWPQPIGKSVLRFLDERHVAQQEISANDIIPDRIIWSPLVAADRATIEIEIPVEEDIQGTLLLPKISHLSDENELLEHGIGRAAECQVDLACNSDPALEKMADAIGKLFFTHEDGVTETCTGTLLENTGDEKIPYLFTASHCLSSQTLADSLNIVWFFRAEQCAGNAASRKQLQTGGAKLLASSADYDWALLRLNETPPEGVVYADWSEEAMPLNASVISLHHPKGDLLKRNDGKVRRFYDSLAIGSSYIEVILDSGANEFGSSGAPLLTKNDKNEYQVRGARMFGYSNCATSNVPDYYIRLDHMIPYVREYLTPQVSLPENYAMVLEYYHRDYDHYFMTANPSEIHSLDTREHTGWVRTGLRFWAYQRSLDGAQPVCRYYMKPEVGDSHFYSASVDECRAVGERYTQSWIFESGNVFYIPLPNTASGECPKNTRPVWRFFHQPETNHRYTTEVSIRDELRITEGWIPEGYGEDAVIMCAPIPVP
jgi:Trypsin.